MSSGQPSGSGRPLVTDVHTHVVSADLPPVDDPFWPVLATDEERPYLRLSTGRRRGVPATAVDMAARIHDMDERGIGRHVLSPMPAQLADVVEDPAVAVAVATAINETVAGYVGMAPERLSGLGTLPVATEPAIRDVLTRCMDHHGLLGVELSSEGFFRLVEADLWPTVHDLLGRAGAWLLVHPQDDALERRRGVSGRLAVGGVSMLNETGLVVAEMMRLGTYGPDGPKVVLSHGGGTTPYLLARMDRLWEATDARRELSRRPSEVFRESFFIDTCVHDSQALALAATRTGPGRLMFGSDYPFVIGVEPSIVLDAGVDAVDDVLWGNADACGARAWTGSPGRGRTAGVPAVGGRR